MAALLDSRVSPALDPETYRSVEGYDDDTRAFVDVVINAFNDAYVTAGKIHDARELWESNPSVTAENRILIVGREADKQKDRVLKRLALAERDLRANIAHVEAQLMEPLTEHAGLGTINSEVRAFVRSLGGTEREKFMADALAQNDGTTLSAVLGAQHFLSGLTTFDRDHYLRRFHQQRQPQQVRRLEVMQRVLERFERGIPVVHAQFDKAVGAKSNAVANLVSTPG